MEIERPRAADLLTRAVVYKKTLLSPDVCRVLLEPATQVYYRAGQFINLHGVDGVIRSYSLASVPHEDCYLEIHVKRIPDGKMSCWIFGDLRENDEIEFHGPLGENYYIPEDKSQNLLLISTGTGVAPHIGIVKDALLSGHQGNIKLYHGSKKHYGHYLWPQLEKLARHYPNFSYVLCASDDAIIGSVVMGRSNEVALEQNKNLRGWSVYLSGRPEMVMATEKSVIASGVSQKNIYADPFEYDQTSIADSLSVPDDQLSEGMVDFERRNTPDPDPEMWQALEEGALMTKILSDFYTRVFDDERLNPYFSGVTKRRLIEKVYNFHYQMFTGKKVYFGDRPKNAHHWMVISDELFDYREALMEACLRENGLPDHLVKRWLEYENMYREDIVKSRPINKIMFGMEMPLDGFDEIAIEASTLCDSCGGEISVGDMVRYHVRLGTTYCTNCMCDLISSSD
jgi:NAD(P)H-flavin reductase